MTADDTIGGVWRTTGMDAGAADSFHFSAGEADATALAGVPFHRVVNNTIYGGATPTGARSAMPGRLEPLTTQSAAPTDSTDDDALIDDAGPAIL